MEPPNLKTSMPWILRKEPEMGWVNRLWGGNKRFKNLLLADADRPQGITELEVRRAVNYLFTENLIGVHPPPAKPPAGPPAGPIGASQTKPIAVPVPTKGIVQPGPHHIPSSNGISAGVPLPTGPAASLFGILPIPSTPLFTKPVPPNSGVPAAGQQQTNGTYNVKQGNPTNGAQATANTTHNANVPTWTEDDDDEPTLGDQRELLGEQSSNKDDPAPGAIFKDKEIEDAVFFSAQLSAVEDPERVKKFIRQYGLMGSMLKSGAPLQDARVFLNSGTPASFFICGLQGSGKSHTLSTILENYLIPSRKLGILRQPLSGLVLHFGEFNSRDAFRPCEAAYLSTPSPHFPHEPAVREVTVLVSPSNYLNLQQAYSKLPRVTVRQLKLPTKDLTIQSMLTLMSINSTTNPPLYMASVTRVLRDMAAQGGEFDYPGFIRKLTDMPLVEGQRRMLDQRLDLLESFLDLENKEGRLFKERHKAQQLTIVDLSCPFVDASTACVLFNICIGLFLAASEAEKMGKVIAVDEAHKYMTDTPASKILTEQLLSIIRQQRHYNTRVVIATQEPTISPRLLQLSSATIIHRFDSPEWFNTIRRHLTLVENGGKEANRLFRNISSLQNGEALVFATSAILPAGEESGGSAYTYTGGSEAGGGWGGGEQWGEGDNGVRIESGLRKMTSDVFKMKVRIRITKDGGATVRSG